MRIKRALNWVLGLEASILGLLLTFMGAIASGAFYGIVWGIAFVQRANATALQSAKTEVALEVFKSDIEKKVDLILQKANKHDGMLEILVKRGE